MIDIHRRAIRARIDGWRDAGLIDDATAGRLRHFESAGDGGAGVPVFTVIGAFTLALGIVAVVSANWDDIPLWGRLGGHVALNLALGVALAVGIGRGRLGPPGSRGREALVTVLSASTLALLAHVGQSFQLQGSTFRLLLAWLVLVSPMTLVLAGGAANRWLWIVGLFATFATGLSEHLREIEAARLVSTAVALFVVLGSAAPLARGDNRGDNRWGHRWGQDISHAMLGAMVVATSLAQWGWEFDIGRHTALRIAGDVLPGTALATIGLGVVHVALARASLARGMGWPRGLSAFVVASPVLAALPVVTGGLNSPTVAAVGFCLYWAAISQLAHGAGRVGLYRLAVVVVAVRIIWVFAEALGGLLLTGVGLVASGAALLALGLVLSRLMRRGAAGEAS
jgi:uncharacterized membrane protein